MPFQLSPGVNVTEIDLTTIVPAVATSTGAIAGIFNWGPVDERVLIDTETKLANIFGKPSSNNAETWFTAANFLNYTNSLYVVRAANTTTTNTEISAFNAVANVGAISIANNVSNVVKNKADFDRKLASNNFDSSAVFVAKYPGALGNSLKVSVCDSIEAYSSTLQANAENASQGTEVEAVFSTSIGSTTLSLAVTPYNGGTAAQANAYAYALVANLAVGDIISLGNSSIGTQLNKIVTIDSITSNASGGFASISLQDPYRLAIPFETSGNTNSTITRYWEYQGVVGVAPTRTDYVENFGNSSAIDSISIVVVDEKGAFSGTPGTILETYVNLSRATDAKTTGGAINYYKEVINESSQYIWLVKDRSGAVSNTASNITTSTNKSALTLNFIHGTNGYSEQSANAYSVVATGYNKFISAEDIDVSLILQGKPLGAANSSYQLANYLIDNVAEVRKDCVVFISPDDSVVSGNTGNEAVALVDWRNSVHDSSYAVMDSGYKYQYDRYNDVYRYIPLNGDIAGLCARTDANRDPWWSPAGFNRGQIKNLVKLRWNPSKGDRDALYVKGINPVVTFPGQGTVLYGDKTLQSKPSAFDRINVRRLFIVLEKAISTASKFTLFEFNDEFTRAQFKNLVTPYLRDVQGRRGITDFLVVCDATNNTPERIDRNEFWGDIYIKPTRSVNFIQLNFVAVRTGVQFSEIVGQF